MTRGDAIAGLEGQLGPMVISPDITATDIAFATIRFCRPLAIALDPEEERAIAHRQLHSYLDGLAANAT